jgi:very-short-patch-repair endonuclease
LRRNPTEPERRLWNRLRADALGVHFRRQYPVGRYIVDFICIQARLVVEIDGDTHAGDVAEAQDRDRSHHLEQRGLRVVRFTNREVMHNLAGVLKAIRSELDRPSPPPSPSGRGG